MSAINSNILFSFRDDDDFESLLNDFLEVTELAPEGFDIAKLNVPLEESEWADREGVLEVSPQKFIIEVFAGEAPDGGCYFIDFTGWQEAYTDVGEIMHGLSYHEPACIELSLKRTWRNTTGIMQAEYEIISYQVS